MKKISIMIATPMYGGMCSAKYAKSLVTEIPKLKDFGYEIVYSDMGNESLITRARNVLTHGFLLSDLDYLLFIDADQSFRAEDIDRMVKSQKKLIGAAVPLKTINWESVASAVLQEKPDFYKYSGVFNFSLLNDQESVDPFQPVEVKHVGTGMMLIHKEVFEKLSKTVPTYKNNSVITTPETESRWQKIYEFWSTSIDEDGVLLSEDYNFCKMWRAAGENVYIDLLAEVVHVGTYEFNGKVFDKASI